MKSIISLDLLTTLLLGCRWPLGCNYTLVSYVQLFIYQSPQVLLGIISLYWCLGLPWLRCNTCAWSSRFSWVHFSSLSRSLWMASFFLLCQLHHSACWGCAWSCCMSLIKTKITRYVKICFTCLKCTVVVLGEGLEETSAWSFGRLVYVLTKVSFDFEETK